jgi:hypothetical protein
MRFICGRPKQAPTTAKRAPGKLSSSSLESIGPVAATRTPSSSPWSTSSSSQPPPPESALSPAEQLVLEVLLKRFDGRASRFMCVQLMRSSDLIKHGRHDPKRVAEWASGAAELIEAVLLWREEHSVDGLATRPVERRERFEEMWPVGISGSDMYGRPVHWQRIAQIPAEAMIREFSVEQVIHLHVQSTERAREACLDKCRRDGFDFVGHVEVLDMTGFGTQHMSKKFYHIVRTVMDVDFKQYDGFFAQMVVINVPWIFAQMWKLIHPLLDVETKAKIHLCDEKASARKLRDLGINAKDRLSGIHIHGELD